MENVQLFVDTYKQQYQVEPKPVFLIPVARQLYKIGNMMLHEIIRHNNFVLYLEYQDYMSEAEIKMVRAHFVKLWFL